MYKSHIIISQLPQESWHEMLGESPRADAILDRLIHGSIKLNLKEESIRKHLNKLSDNEQLS
nr:ATP-binding protein [Pseudoalteromonas sp. CIP111951]